MDVVEREVLSGATAGIVAADDQGRIVFTNAAASDAMGRQIAVGADLMTLMPERLRPRHADGFRRYVKTGHSRLEGKTVRVPALTEDGSEREIDLTIRIFQRPDGTRLAVAGVEVAGQGRPPRDLIRIESELQQRMYSLV